jgi:hypothetical protein
VNVPPPDWLTPPLLARSNVAPAALLSVALFSRTRLLAPASLMVPSLVRVPAPVITRLPPVVLAVRVPVSR